MPEPASDIPPHRYTAALASEMERRWQAVWEASGVYRAPNPGEAGFDPLAPKFYVLDMFPYPSGAGLHVGHPLGYIATDIVARFKRMCGFNVLHAMGFDAFGLPAEQYALETGTHPRVTTEKNITTFRAQLARLGLGHERRRGVSTTDVDFYRWTQWIFLQIYNAWYDEAAPGGGRARPIAELVDELERGVRPVPPASRPWARLSAAERAALIDSYRLAYLADVNVNWCPALGTVLANEEVTSDGRSERGNHPVHQRPLRQWMMRITAYAERLLSDLEPLHWPEPIKLMQRNWIGKSEGAYVDFDVGKRRIRVFTTRPDTLYGACALVLAPDHPLVDELAGERFGAGVPEAWRGVFEGSAALRSGGAGPREMIASYRAGAASKTDLERQDAGRDKTGVFIGAYAINPASGERIPIFIADYVLMGYGTGAVMVVPAHDERDYAFAKLFGLAIKDVVYPRLVLAMRHYSARATETERAGEGWFGVLADFLGLVASRDVPPEGFEAALATVRARRSDDPDAPRALSIETRRLLDEVPGGLGARRGSVRLTWMEAIEDLGFASFNELRGWFEAGRFYDATGAAFTGHGFATNSRVIEGLPTERARGEMTRWLEAQRLGLGAVQYKLRDWLFSRQRYWGEPFPIVYAVDDVSCARPIALPDSMLPVELPEISDYRPQAGDDPSAPPRPPLGRAESWALCTLDLGDGPRRYRRELNTMPQWAGSCWYYLRYLDPSNVSALAGHDIERYWMLSGSGAPGAERSAPPHERFDPAKHHWGGVDLYVGGAEHAVLHLLYARFWHKVLFDLRHVSTPEPFGRLFNQGYIQAPAFRDERGVYVEASKVAEEPGERGRFSFEGRAVTREFGKMGKSLKNVVTPDEVCDEFGADTMRLYEMSMGPLEQSKPWNPRDIVGMFRFLQRVWRVLIDEETGAVRVGYDGPDDALRRLLHKTIEGVRRDVGALSFNTAIAKLIEFNNALGKRAPESAVPAEVARALVLMLAPMVPHFAEELWSRLVSAGVAPAPARGSVVYERFPVADPALLVEESIELPVQVMGKVRGRVTIASGAAEDQVRSAALALPAVRALTEGKTIAKVIIVPGKMVNVVVS